VATNCPVALNLEPAVEGSLWMLANRPVNCLCWLGVCLRIQADLFFFEDNALDELSSETDFSLGINRDDG
jgi:hypothetical protein